MKQIQKNAKTIFCKIFYSETNCSLAYQAVFLPYNNKWDDGFEPNLSYELLEIVRFSKNSKQLN